MSDVEEAATPVESSDRTLREELEANLEAVQERDERPRGPDGKFVAKDDEPVEKPVVEKPVKAKEAPPVQETQDAPEPVVEQVKVDTPAPVTAPPNLIAAPSSWSNPAKAKWAALDPELRAEIAKREADVHKGFTKMDEERNFAKEMQRVVAPYEAVIRAAGSSTPAAVQSVLNTAYILKTADPATKAQAIRQVCQEYGIDMSQLSQQQHIDPALSATQQELAQIKQQLQQQQQEQENARQNEVLSTIQAFGQDPKHPFFNDVQIEMGALIQAGRAENLEQAYEMAIWARPDLRQHLLAEQQKAAQREAAQKATKARAKGVSVRGGPGGTPTVAPADRSLREELEAQMAAASGRI